MVMEMDSDMVEVASTLESSSIYEQWGVSRYVIERLRDKGIVEPTAVQRECWEPILAGRDLLVQSQTGTGKTLAFALPLLHKSAGGRGKVEVLVVLPTRELAMQVAKSWEEIGANVALLYGGGGYAEQIGALKAGVRLVVGTPGRICDHLTRGSLDLSECRTLVLDEADEMLDMGFAEEIDKILEALPKERQSLLFSATLQEQMENLASKTLRHPQRVSVSCGLTVATDIVHQAYEVEREYKHDALYNILLVEAPRSALIFCHTKVEADELSERLRSDGVQAACLHGDMSQAERTRTLNSFRRGHLRFLVATDVAARGLDIRNITHVINLSVPREAETYIHRVGRTGRAGDHGVAITLVSPRDLYKFKGILKSAKISVDIRPLPQRADVRRIVRESFHTELCQRIEKGVDPAFQVLAKELLEYLEPSEIVSALLSTDPQAKACINAGFDIPIIQRKKKRNPEEEKIEKKRQRLADTVYNLARLGRAYMQVNVGHSDEGVDEDKLLQLLVAMTGKSRKYFGRLNMRRRCTSFEADISDAENIAIAMDGLNWEGHTLRVRVVDPGSGDGLENPRYGGQKIKTNSSKFVSKGRNGKEKSLAKFKDKSSHSRYSERNNKGHGKRRKRGIERHQSSKYKR